MDKIEIRVESHHGDAVTKDWSAVFGLAGGTIGRSGQNKLVLPDTDAHVARVHAMVRLEADNAYIANLCERRAILVDAHELPSGQEMILPMGAQIHIGPYQLRAVAPGSPRQAVELPSVLATMPLPVAAAPKAAPAASAAPPLLDDNPFAFIGRVEAPRPAPPPAPAAPPAPPPGAPRALLIPDDFDPFARDVDRERRDNDPWAGGPPMQNLADMAPVRDDLLRSLPEIGRVDQASPLNRQAVSGLPASLDPEVELDPMRLFESAPTLPGLPPESARLLNGSELGQAMRLPQEANPVPARPAPPAAPAVTPPPGLQQVQGLDLSMFDRTPAASELPPAPESTIFSHIDANLAPTQLLPMRRAVPAAPVPSLDLDLDGPAPVPGRPDAALLAPAVPVSPVPPVVRPAEATVAPPPQPEPAPAPVPPAPPAAPRPQPTSAAATPAAAPTADELQALMNAFIDGIGLTPDRVKAELTPEFMHRFGQTLRTAVQGTMDLLHARSEIKREFRADVTIMATRANNPLKFLPDADGVMMQMMGQTFPGFMLPVPSMQEAYRDLRVHQLALMAGIRAAYAEALTRFDPQQLEKQAAEPGGLLGKLGQSRRKAALWDDYKQRYADIRRHAEDDLAAFSGRTFVRAYEAAADAAEDSPDELPGKRP